MAKLPLKPSRRDHQRRSNTSQGTADKRKRERRGASAFFQKANQLSNAFDRWTKVHTYLRPVSENNLPITHIRSGEPKIMLGSNSFLGLATHPKVKEAAIEAIRRFGIGTGGPPVLNGTTVLHDQLCEELADFKGTEAAVLFPSGYLANFTCISTLFGDKSFVLLNDELNHASLIDGSRNTKAALRFFKHNDSESLRKKLEQYDETRTKVVIADGVCSMDGDICDLPNILAVARRNNALVMIDDAHATGVIGPTGRGTAEHHGLMGKVDITTVTLSKSLGSVGGAICGSRALVKYLVHLSRAYIFSASLPAPICAASLAALKILRSEPELVARLHRNVTYLVDGLINLGFDAKHTQSAIVPIIIGDEKLTYRLAFELDQLGVFVNAISRPAVPREFSRLRLSPTAAHTIEDLDRALDAFEKAKKRLRIA